MNTAFIIDAVRTPRAKRKGKFSGIHPVDLLTFPLNAVLKRNDLGADSIEDLAIGCVTQTGEQGWCIARAAILAAGWPVTVPGCTINRLCGSGQQALNFTASSIQAGTYGLAIAGGVEHMTRTPMFSDISGEVSPLLRKHHPDLVQQGFAAELLADKFRISREDMDAFALKSQQLAAQARNAGKFSKSIIPIEYQDESGNTAKLTHDDNPRPESTLESLKGLKTVFKENGKVTAGNASAIVDGAAAILMASEDKTKRLRLKPRARIVASIAVGSDPLIMLSGPIAAIPAVLKKAGLELKDIDLFEINEAFAPVVIAAQKTLNIDPDKINVNGGAIALGHPLGATGAILINTVLDELELRNKRYGLVSMCIGLGMGIATIIERV